jgi:hypothetical protein
MLKNELDKLSASFISERTELLYRNNFLAGDRRQTIVGLILLCIPVIVFGYSDYMLFGNSAQFHYLLVARSIAVLLAGFTLLFLIKSKNIFTKDTLVLSTLLFFACLQLYINLGRPSNYYQYTTFDILVVFALYTLIPNRYFFQIIAAASVSVFNIYVFTFHKNLPSNLAITVFGFSYLFVNAIGLWISWNLHIYRRRQFATQLEQIATTEKLQLANSEIKTLQGILPLCSGCKKIRDDKGYWSQIDAYIEAHTDTQFSHGMCSKCVETLYGDQEWYKRSKNKQSDFTQYSP